VFQPGGVTLDLSSIAKGFAVDKVSASLHAHGIHNHLVEIGGELNGQGIKPDGSPWWVALESFPKGDGRERAHDAVVALHGLAIATSGDHVRFFEQGGERFSHTIDPRSGYPVVHALTSVTVLHRSCMQADALATALFVLGPEEGFNFAAHHNVAARLVSRADGGYVERMTPQLVAMLGD
jgi:thiamine biosynthesis lipoprotein